MIIIIIIVVTALPFIMIKIIIIIEVVSLIKIIIAAESFIQIILGVIDFFIKQLKSLNFIIFSEPKEIIIIVIVIDSKLQVLAADSLSILAILEVLLFACWEQLRSIAYHLGNIRHEARGCCDLPTLLGLHCLLD